MSIYQDIENKTADQLRAEHEPIANALGDAEKGDLIDRYLQALTDAKARDELLRSQGEMVTSQRTTIETANQQLKQAQAALTNAQNEAAAFKQRVDALNDQLDTARAELESEAKRSGMIQQKLTTAHRVILKTHAEQGAFLSSLAESAVEPDASAAKPEATE